MGKISRNKNIKASNSIKLSSNDMDNDDENIVIDLVDIKKDINQGITPEYQKSIDDIKKSRENDEESIFDYAYSLRFKNKNNSKVEDKEPSKKSDVHWFFKMIKKHSTLWFYAVGWSFLAIAAWLIASALM